MKVLAITGKIAEEIVKKSVKELRNVEVQILPISVAAFMTPEFIIKNLNSLDSKYDMILLPGSIQGDVSSVEEKFGIPTYKGTTHAADIALCFEDGVELSKIQSATEIYKSKIQKRAFEKIDFINKNRKKILSEYGGFLLGSAKREVPIGSHFPMPVIAEIVNAPIRTSEEVAQISKYYQKEGAEIIDIGMIAGRPLPEKIPEIIETIHSSVELPISIDTLNEDEIISAVKSEVDLVLSIDSGNMANLAEICRDIPVVVLPSNIRKGWLPREAEERVRSLNNNLENAKKSALDLDARLRVEGAAHSDQADLAPLLDEPILVYRPLLQDFESLMSSCHTVLAS